MISDYPALGVDLALGLIVATDKGTSVCQATPIREEQTTGEDDEGNLIKLISYTRKERCIIEPKQYEAVRIQVRLDLTHHTALSRDTTLRHQPSDGHDPEFSRQVGAQKEWV
jgi:hypothetical protein